MTFQQLICLHPCKNLPRVYIQDLFDAGLGIEEPGNHLDLQGDERLMKVSN